MATRIAYRAQFGVNPKDMAALARALKSLDKKVRRKVLRAGLKEWGNRLKLAIRRRVWPSDRATRRDLAVKIKTYKRGKIVWCGVGVRKDGNRVGWRSHFFDGGWRPWPKGTKADLTQAKAPTRPGRNPNPRFVPFSYRRDWRKGKKKTGPYGRLVHRTQYIQGPAMQWTRVARQYVEDAIAKTIREEASYGK